MKFILALDLSTKTGWALSPEVGGVIDLSIRRDESAGMRLIRFRSKLNEIQNAYEISLVVFEKAIAVPGRVQGYGVQIELQSVLKVWAEDRGIEYRSFTPSEVKRHATGKGNSKKDKMVAAAEARGWRPVDDNHADALWLLDLASSEYKSVR